MSEIRTGWFEDLPMTDYLRLPAVSASGLVELRRSPAHYDEARRNPRPQTPEMAEGTALHLALLEPHLFEGRYVSLGQCSGVYSSGKNAGQRCSNPAIVRRAPPFDCDFCGVHDPAKGEPMPEGIEVMPAEALTRIEAMKAAVLAHPEASSFFREGGRSELTGVWIDEATGVPCKIRLDRDPDSRQPIHADLKRVADASVKGFERAVIRMGYTFRSAFYRRGMAALGRPAIGSVLIAVEAQPPHGVQTFLLDEGDIEAFQPEITRLLRTYAACKESGRWEAYPSGFRHLKLPKWEEPAPAADFNDHDEHRDAA